jgi:hypothetical protein
MDCGALVGSSVEDMTGVGIEELQAENKRIKTMRVNGNFDFINILRELTVPC